jgi:hypothetical protein
MSTVIDKIYDNEIQNSEIQNNGTHDVIKDRIDLLPLYHPNLYFLLRVNHPNLDMCFYHYTSNISPKELTSSLRDCKYQCNGKEDHSVPNTTERKQTRCNRYLSIKDVLEGKCVWNIQARAIKKRGEELDELRRNCYECKESSRSCHRVCYEDIKNTLREEEVLGTLGLRKIKL